ncbi:helix-turn-helix domain-containing protein [Bifidobacterium longum]|nr:helix-turn-helix domain-containing protein [Bifidobacterium longum]
MKAYSHLSAEERIRIDELRNRDGLGVRQIALRIGRDKATVSRELKRGLWFACFASMFVRQVRQCFSVVWADGFPRCRHRFPVM